MSTLQGLPEGVVETVDAINRELKKKPKKSKRQKLSENLLPNAIKIQRYGKCCSQ